ncbi:MAG: glycosyltransferase family 2 protein [Bacteroidales bacterium]|jgi:glycosyltransferase involved in cell wall biosynthesis|nr:glycosyltransferase family 2 protein [Bacteroidales bacterium]
MNKLYIVIPAYNEEANIRTVTNEWHKVAAKTGADSRLVIVDDGSRDNTYNILAAMKKELPQLTVLSKPNGGHGAAVLYGYRYALEKGADYVFQTDSDGQTVPDEFWQFWEKRQEYTALIGRRSHRKDGFSRVFVTKVLRLVLRIVFRLDIPDANTPFRLLKAEALSKYLPLIPPDFNLSNIMLSVCLARYKEKTAFIPITFKPRQGGINSINFKKIVKIGVKAVNDFSRIKKEMDVNQKENHK